MPGNILQVLSILILIATPPPGCLLRIKKLPGSKLSPDLPSHHPPPTTCHPPHFSDGQSPTSSSSGQRWLGFPKRLAESQFLLCCLDPAPSFHTRIPASGGSPPTPPTHGPVVKLARGLCHIPLNLVLFLSQPRKGQGSSQHHPGVCTVKNNKIKCGNLNISFTVLIAFHLFLN